METKPYSLQSPEQIAKDYGGNKQRIAEAMQMGIIDPTAGTMAGMFIDRMRMAQQQEMAPQQTVAQQVFAPPAPPMGAMPPAGLGATPQAAAMPPMPGGAPMMAPPPPAPPMGAPGMAAGGLTTLPLPDDMFNEPDVGGYAAGGIVAFQAGGGVDDEEVPITPIDREGITTPAPGFPSLDIPGAGRRDDEDKEPTILRGVRYAAPATLSGFKDDPFANLDTYNTMARRETAEARAYADYLRQQLSPEERQRRRQEDMWTTLGQIGARMASTPGSLLQAVGAGLSEAVPAAAAAARERRGEERTTRQALLQEERAANREVETRANVALDMLRQYSTLERAFQDSNFTNTLQRLGIDAQYFVAQLRAGVDREIAALNAATGRYSADRQFDATMANNLEQQNRAFGTFLESNAGTMALRALMSGENGMGAGDAMTTLRESFFGRGGGGSSGLPAGFVPD